MSSKTKLLAALALALMFAGGFVAGFAVHRAMAPPPGRHIPAFAGALMIRHLDRRLDLTDEQRRKIEEILARRHERMAGMYDDVQPRLRAELIATNAEIEAVLTPEQRREFQTLRMHLRPHRRGPHAPPPPRN